MKKYSFFILLLCAMTGCSEFLEPKSQSEYVPEEAASLNEMLLGEAYPLPNATNKGISSLDLVFDDDLACGNYKQEHTGNSASIFTGFRALFSWQPDMFVTAKQQSVYGEFSVWEDSYLFIRGANAALDYIDQVSGTTNEKANVKAQAYALRAFYYFHLVNLWGEPYNYNKKAWGVPLKLTSAMEDRDLPRNTVEEVYEQILADLDQAETLYRSLPEEMQYRKDNRTSLPMVELLKSRVYLYMENWEKAAEYAKKVIDNRTFELIDLNTVKTSAKHPYYNFISNDCPENIWLFGNINRMVQYVGKRVALPKDGSSEDTKYRMKFNASPDLLKGFVDGDLRKQHYIVQEYEYPGTYLAFGKWGVSASHTSLDGTEFAQAFRLPEAYLNLAEAAAQLNDPATALTALNTLREKRFTPATYAPVENLSGRQLIDRIRHERRLELCFEGHRWFDLRRYGMPSFSRTWIEDEQKVQVYTLHENDPSYTLPIPQIVLERNRKLIQNKLANPR